MGENEDPKWQFRIFYPIQAQICVPDHSWLEKLGP